MLQNSLRKEIIEILHTLEITILRRISILRILRIILILRGLETPQFRPLFLPKQHSRRLEVLKKFLKIERCAQYFTFFFLDRSDLKYKYDNFLVCKQYVY